MFSQVSIILWDEWFWLPQQFKWKDLRSPTTLDLSLSVLLGLGIWASRSLFINRYIFKTFGVKVSFDVETNSRRESLLQERQILKSNGDHKQDSILGSQKGTSPSAENVDTQKCLHSTCKKCDHQSLENLSYHSWRLAFLTSLWIFGMCFLASEPWFWNVQECWIGFPYQGVTWSMFLYYSSSIGFYWSLIFNQLWDCKRGKEFLSTIKYLLNIFILYALWMAGLMRIGTVIVLINGSAKIPFEATQIFRLLGRRKLFLTFYLVYILTWLISRLIIFPSHVLKATLIDAKALLGTYPMYYVLNALVFSLVLLHILRAFALIQVDTDEIQRGNSDNNKKCNVCSSKVD
ncbi:unnamed protein product [Allacma fusca]|uniref:TLC domain-containing protein n=1 Tax=Allacma fusca TaxID=39272 RepID=A0A8J2KG10_9HEXA|nr:unnamed protein product [Allacma fusca]